MHYSAVDLVTGLRRSSPAMKWGVALISVFAVVYCVVLLHMNSDDPFEFNYAGFMRSCASTGVLPSFLLFLQAGSIRCKAFDRVRRDPRWELLANTLWMMAANLVAAFVGTSLFAFMECVLMRQTMTPAHVSLLVMMFVQLMMMNGSVALIILFLVNCGLSFGQVTPVAIAFYTVGNWLLTSLRGDAERIIFYFWYPISPLWSIVFVKQVVPFIGYCVLMAMVIVIAFERTDRLDA